MIGFGRNQHSLNHFSVRSHIELPRPPPVVAPVEEFDDDSEEEVVIRPKKGKRHRLPGAKLLKSLAKQREREKAARKHERRAKKERRRQHREDVDVDEMAARLRRMFTD